MSHAVSASLSLKVPHQRQGMPRQSMSPKRQLQAIERVQDAADKRVKLGMQLYRAAQVHTAHNQSMVELFKRDQQRMRDELSEDLTRSLHSYDQWVGKLDNDMTGAIQKLEDRIDQLQSKWQSSQQDIDAMIKRSEALMDQSRQMMGNATLALTQVNKQVPLRLAGTAKQAKADPKQPKKMQPQNPLASFADDSEHPTQAGPLPGDMPLGNLKLSQTQSSPEQTSEKPDTSTTEPTRAKDKKSASRLYLDIIDRMNQS